MIRARRRSRREMRERAYGPTDVGEGAFEPARPAGPSYAEMESAWRESLSAAPPHMRLGVYPDDDPRHRVEVEAWWHNTQRLRSAPRSKALEGG